MQCTLHTSHAALPSSKLLERQHGYTIRLRKSHRLASTSIAAPASRSALARPRIAVAAASQHREMARSWAAPAARQAAALAAGVFASLLLVTTPVAHAELQTVTASEATSAARELKKQPVNKGRIWLLLILGAAALFGSTVVLENNSQFFPAISRANRAMAASQRKQEGESFIEAEVAAQAEERQQALLLQGSSQTDEEYAEQARLLQAVQAGMADASKRVSASSSPSSEAAGAAAVASSSVFTNTAQQAQQQQAAEYPATLEAGPSAVQRQGEEGNDASGTASGSSSLSGAASGGSSSPSAAGESPTGYKVVEDAQQLPLVVVEDPLAKGQQLAASATTTMRSAVQDLKSQLQRQGSSSSSTSSKE